MKQTRRVRVPAAFAAAQECDEKARYEMHRAVDDCLRWRCVRDEMMAWATALTTTNCGWAQYAYAQEFLRVLGEAERRRPDA